MAGAFTYGASSNSLPVGSICQAPYNLTDPNWLPCDGRKVSRSQYPLLSACLPSIGTFTATSRTKSATPTSSAIATDGTSWVVTGSVGAVNVQTTPDGITYTPRIVPANTDIRSILFDGTNFVAAATGATASPKALLSSNGGVTWSSATTQPTAGPSSVAFQTCMTWASSLGTVGRFVLVVGGTQVYTSDDRGVTWVNRAGALGASSGFGVCWTGQKFIALSGDTDTIYTSTDGITWAAQALPFSTSASTASTGSIISDGNGKVLWTSARANPGTIYTSLDHGVAWSQREFALALPTGGGTLQFQNCVASYTNGSFFIVGVCPGASTCLLASSDLIGWAYLDTSQALLSAAAFSYKAGVYFSNVDSASAAALTLVEDTTKMYLPLGAQNATNTSWNNFMPFIKVK